MASLVPALGGRVPAAAVLLLLAILFSAASAQVQVQFVETLYQPTVDEEQPVGTSVTDVAAFYIDSGVVGTDGTFSLYDSEDARHFTVDTRPTLTRTVGIIRTAAVFDRDAPGAQTEFLFDAIYAVTLSNGSEITASAVVNVFIGDVNDNPPRFTESVFSAYVLEDAPGGSHFFTLTANDPDLVQASQTIDEGTEEADFAGLIYLVSNGRIIYTISAGNEQSLFVLDPDTGELSTASGVVLDVDVAALYTLTVLATDGGGLQDNATVLVNVLDSNDNAPQIVSPLGVNVTLPEDIAVGYVVVEEINATDADSGLNAAVEFAIADGDITNSFSVDASTGRINVTSPLDREAGSIVNLTVVARDQGVPPLRDTIQVVVNLLDVNDYAPVFQQASFEASVLEAVPTDTSVVQVTAVDLDMGRNGTVSYTILNSSKTASFVIDSASGLITTSGVIDRETNPFFSFQVIAVDNPENSSYQLSSVVNVSVTIDDINDNPPLFSSETFRADILDNVTSAEVIAQVVATDADAGANGEIRYRIEVPDPNRPHHFRIDPMTGFVYRNGQLRFEDQSLYHYTIRALDSGGFPLSTDVNLTIYVYDVNRRPPKFEADAYNATLLETIPITTVVLNVSASDPDPGPIGEVRYRITTDFDAAGSFTVNEITGEVAVASRLDFDFR